MIVKCKDYNWNSDDWISYFIKRNLSSFKSSQSSSIHFSFPICVLIVYLQLHPVVQSAQNKSFKVREINIFHYSRRSIWYLASRIFAISDPHSFVRNDSKIWCSSTLLYSYFLKIILIIITKFCKYILYLTWWNKVSLYPSSIVCRENFLFLNRRLMAE